MGMIRRRHRRNVEDPDTLRAKNPEHPVDAQEPVGTSRFEKPSGNASLEAWQEYAVAQGKYEADLDGLTRNEIRDLFEN